MYYRDDVCDPSVQSLIFSYEKCSSVIRPAGLEVSRHVSTDYVGEPTFREMNHRIFITQ